MPKELTHWIIAERALERLEPASALRREITAHRSLYLAGAVLPDSLLHIFKPPYDPTARALAHRFHDAPGNSYEPLIRAEASFPSGLSGALLSCLCGVMCHIHADMVMHPFVYAGCGKDTGRHYRLETDLDVRFLRAGARPPARRLSELVHPRTRPVLVEAAGLLFDPLGELPRQALEEALSLHCRFQGMYDRPWWKLAALVLAKLMGSPIREQRHLFYPLFPGGSLSVQEGGEWRCPVSGAPNSATVDELAEEAVRLTAEALQRIDTHGSLAAALSDPPGANLLTGRFGVTESAMYSSTYSLRLHEKPKALPPDADEQGIGKTATFSRTQRASIDEQ